MMRPPILQLAAQCAGSAVVLGLFVLRGFNLREHARILLGALAVCWLVGALWILATAAENAAGWRRLGVGNALLVLAETLAVAFAPAIVLWLIAASH
jgi:hypothetical protein